MVTAGVAWSYTGPWWGALASRVPGGDRRSVRDATWSRGASGNSGNSGESQGDNPGSVRDSRGHGEKTRQKRCTAGTAVQGCGGVDGRQQERPRGYSGQVWLCGIVMGPDMAQLRRSGREASAAKPQSENPSMHCGLLSPHPPGQRTLHVCSEWPRSASGREGQDGSSTGLVCLSCGGQ